MKITRINEAAVSNLPQVCGGLFRVSETGCVYRRKDGYFVLAAQSRMCRNKKYLVVSAYTNGKQKQFYVHRLVAEAYIPNPDNKPTINHIDCNPLNNHVSNLEWATYKENSAHAVENGLMRSKYTRGIPCLYCGTPTLAHDGMCKSCKVELRMSEKRAAIAEKKAEVVGAIIDKVDMSKISDRNTEILRQYARGGTLQEIGDSFSISRERVRKIIDTYLNQPEKKFVASDRQTQISEYILQMGFSRRFLAARSGVKQSAFYNMIKLKSKMPEAVFLKLAELTKFELPA